jgi:hypothetical protein
MLMDHDDEAFDQAQRALAEARELQQPTLEAAALYASGLSHFNSDSARALSLLRESIDLSERIGDEFGRFAALKAVAALEAFHGDEHRALEAVRDQIATPPGAKPVDDDAWTGAVVFNRVGRPDLVARCYGMSRRFRGTWPPLYGRLRRHAVDEARAALGDELFDQHAAEAASMPPNSSGRRCEAKSTNFSLQCPAPDQPIGLDGSHPEAWDAPFVEVVEGGGVVVEHLWSSMDRHGPAPASIHTAAPDRVVERSWNCGIRGS